MNNMQKSYGIGEKLLAIVQILQKFKTMLFGQGIKLYTDHKIITFETFSLD